jgi:thioredoxin-related protein
MAQVVETAKETKDPVLSAETILKNAYARADKEKKNVIIIFHASWCGWCHKMDTAMNDKSVRKFFTDNYVIEHLVVDESKDKKDLENPGAADFRKKYGGDGQGIPFWLVFDKEGKLLADSKIKPGTTTPDGDNTGCPASEKEVDYFVKVLKQTSKLTDAELDVVRKRFRKNE